MRGGIRKRLRIPEGGSARLTTTYLRVRLSASCTDRCAQDVSSPVALRDWASPIRMLVLVFDRLGNVSRCSAFSTRSLHRPLSRSTLHALVSNLIAGSTVAGCRACGRSSSNFRVSDLIPASGWKRTPSKHSSFLRSARAVTHCACVDPPDCRSISHDAIGSISLDFPIRARRTPLPVPRMNPTLPFAAGASIRRAHSPTAAKAESRSNSAYRS